MNKYVNDTINVYLRDAKLVLITCEVTGLYPPRKPRRNAKPCRPVMVEYFIKAVNKEGDRTFIYVC